VAISSPSAGDLVSGPVSIAASAADDVGVTQVEFFVDGVSIGVDTDDSNGWSAAWDSTLVPDGSHSLSVTATDTQSQTGSAGITVTVDNVPEPKMHVGDLAQSVTPAKGGRWNATVTVTVHDASHNGLAGALVSMAWSDGKTATCTTGSDGSCTIVRKGIPSSISTLTLEVTAITLSGAVYDASINEEGSIAVNKP
jgi:hypothetical protein